MEIMTKTCTICEITIYNSLQLYHISVYGTTHKTLGHTHPGIVTATEKVEYSPPTKGMESERNFSFDLSSIYPERSLKTHERFHPENHQ